ncbi:hypothetical protein AHAS_Ahas19G0288800 [Arachis hypogaea]
MIALDLVKHVKFGVFVATVGYLSSLLSGGIRLLFVFVKAWWKNDEFGLMMDRINNMYSMMDIHVTSIISYKPPEGEGSVAGVGMTKKGIRT